MKVSNARLAAVLKVAGVLLAIWSAGSLWLWASDILIIDPFLVTLILVSSPFFYLMGVALPVRRPSRAPYF